MILLIRPDPPRNFLESSLRTFEQERTRNWFLQPPSQRGEKAFVFRSAVEISEFMDEVGKAFYNKCAYCETRLDTISDESLSFFRPREEAAQLDGTCSLDHYWWLSWEWSNYYLACARCIRAKDRKFPTMGARAQPETLGAELSREEPLLLDPCSDEPSRHLLFEETGILVPKNGSVRGKATIEILDLNRRELLAVRKKHSQKLKDILQKALRATQRNQAKLTPAATSHVHDLARYCETTETFAGMSRQLLLSWIRQIDMKVTLEFQSVSIAATHWQSLIKQLETYESGSPNNPEEFPMKEIDDSANLASTGQKQLAGYWAIDERATQIIEEVQQTMPQVNADHLNDFGVVLAAITNYMGINLQQALYREGVAVSEADFQKNVLYHLRTRLGDEVREAPRQGGGPTDIQYKSVTVELKVEKHIRERQKFIEKYLSQTTQYSSAGGAQLGILCVLDLTEKVMPPANPQNHITLEIPEVHGFNAPKFPTKIAVVVIDGNLRSPSSYSR